MYRFIFLCAHQGVSGLNERLSSSTLSWRVPWHAMYDIGVQEQTRHCHSTRLKADKLCCGPREFGAHTHTQTHTKHTQTERAAQGTPLWRDQCKHPVEGEVLVALWSGSGAQDMVLADKHYQRIGEKWVGQPCLNTGSYKFPRDRKTAAAHWGEAKTSAEEVVHLCASLLFIMSTQRTIKSIIQ